MAAVDADFSEERCFRLRRGPDDQVIAERISGGPPAAWTVEPGATPAAWSVQRADIPKALRTAAKKAVPHPQAHGTPKSVFVTWLTFVLWVTFFIMLIPLIELSIWLTRHLHHGW